MGAVFLFAGVMDTVDIIGAWQVLPDPGELFSDIVMAIGGGGALLTGLRMNHTHKLERLLDKVVGERDNIPPAGTVCRRRGGCRPRTRCREKRHRARILRRGCLY